MNSNEFEILLEKYLADKRNKIKAKYNRVLPTGELLFNRFDKAKYLGYDETTSVYDSAVIMGDVKIGKHCWVGPNSLIEAANASITIGDYVSIASAVHIYSHDSSMFMLSGGKTKYITGEVNIGSNVAVGSASIIYCGVSIGNRCLVGANSFVNRNVPDNSIVMGCPAKIVGEVKLRDDGTVYYKYNKK